MKLRTMAALAAAVALALPARAQDTVPPPRPDSIRRDPMASPPPRDTIQLPTARPPADASPSIPPA
ncbi:MAG TPA: hypothetical protein VFJ16_05160, partial [Longimicrobium sp.]|nr:hypothetical protein [Longimicrobium sp.]